MWAKVNRLPKVLTDFRLGFRSGCGYGWEVCLTVTRHSGTADFSAAVKRAQKRMSTLLPVLTFDDWPLCRCFALFLSRRM